MAAKVTPKLGHYTGKVTGGGSGKVNFRAVKIHKYLVLRFQSVGKATANCTDGTTRVVSTGGDVPAQGSSFSRARDYGKGAHDSISGKWNSAKKVTGRWQVTALGQNGGVTCAGPEVTFTAKWNPN